MTPLLVLAIAHLENSIVSTLDTFTIVWRVPEQTRPWRDFRDRGRLPSGIGDFQPPDHYRSAVQEGVDLDCYRPGAAGELKGHELILGVLYLRLLRFYPTPATCQVFSFNCQLKSINRERFHNRTLLFEMAFGLDHTGGKPVPADPTAFPQCFVAHRKSRTEADSGLSSLANRGGGILFRSRFG